ncbi:sensor histidine kinase, partial [Winogradskyella sp.]|uniref:ligand-binding sensor domain-containing protein n=1 Tax=Winogradskyella sp. TaxID=1883156 RepID=UPI0025E6A2B0
MNLILFVGLTFAQEAKQFSFRNLTVNDGLSQNSIVSIAQDSIGYVWFATQDGLNKYDGRSFTHYDKQFQDITRTTYSHLGQLYTDEFGDFWIYSLNGWLERYNYKTKTFEGVIEISNVTKIYRPTKEKLWIGTLENGLYEIDISSKTSKKIFPEALSSKSVFDLLKINDTYLLATSNGIYTIEQGKISSAFSSKNIPISSLKKHNNLLIAGTYSKGLLCYDLVTKKTIDEFANLFPQGLNIQDVLVDSKSRLWITTYGNGVFMKTSSNNIVNHFEAKKEDPYALHYNDVLTVFEDNTGVIWLGTDGSGLSFYDETLAKFNVMTNSQTPANIHVDVIRAIAVSEEKVWLGTSGKGLTKLNRNNRDEAYTFTSQNSNIASDRIMSLHLHNSDLWIGHQGAGLQVLKDNRFTTISQLNKKTIWKIISDNSNHIWIATRNSGFYKLDIEGNIINNWSQENTSLPTNNIRTLAFSEDNSLLYIGTDNDGVYTLNQKNNQINPIEGISNATKSLVFDNNKLYIGTNGDGIKILNTKSNNITHITKENGLPNEVIYGILKDNDENIWISSNRGISKIKITNSEIKITNYSNYDGLQAFEFNTGAYVKAEDGTLFFGGLEGFNWFRPSQLQLNTVKPKTIISKVELFNKPIEEAKTTFKHHENTLTFTFSSLQFSQPERNLYQYKLAPYDKDWILSNNINLAHYTNLEPDNYSFYVKSSNYDGLWSNETANYKFIIEKPWYKTNLAYFIYALLFLFSLYSIYSYFKFKWKLETQVRLEHAETERLMQLDEFKTKLYTNISHEFRTPLTLISGPIDKQLANKTLKEEDKKELQLVKQNAMRLLGLVNQMMDLSLIDAGQIKLKVEQGNLGIILKQLVAAFQYKANEKSIKINATINNLEDCWFDKDILEKIGSNLLSNAIKYAPEKTQVYFTAQQQNEQLQLSIINQNDQVKADKLGELFKRFYQNNETSEGIGVGLALVKDLVTLSKGTILANTLD